MKRIMAQVNQRGPAFKDVNWDAFATVDPRYVDQRWMQDVVWHEGGKTYRWSPFGYWEPVDDEDEEPPTQRFRYA